MIKKGNTITRKNLIKIAKRSLTPKETKTEEKGEKKTVEEEK